MPKINVVEIHNERHARTDKAERARERAIGDLRYIQDYPKMYINEKKQLQAYVKILYDLGFYENNNTIFDLCDNIE